MLCSTGPTSLDCLQKIAMHAMHALDARLELLMRNFLALWDKNDTIRAMRILERVQPFCTSFKYWDFYLFPPSYVVTKLT